MVVKRMLLRFQDWSFGALKVVHDSAKRRPGSDVFVLLIRRDEQTRQQINVELRHAHHKAQYVSHLSSNISR